MCTKNRKAEVNLSAKETEAVGQSVAFCVNLRSLLQRRPHSLSGFTIDKGRRRSLSSCLTLFTTLPKS